MNDKRKWRVQNQGTHSPETFSSGILVSDDLFRNPIEKPMNPNIIENTLQQL